MNLRAGFMILVLVGSLVTVVAAPAQAHTCKRSEDSKADCDPSDCDGVGHDHTVDRFMRADEHCKSADQKALELLGLEGPQTQL